MRARSIKPGICDNEILGTADPFYTLLFERLWMIADREGRLEDRPLRIKAQAFPYRDGLDVEPMLCWLAEQGFIARYEVCGKRYIQILTFNKHQSPHKNEQASVIPPMPDESTTKVVPAHNQGSAMDALTPSSLTPDSGLLTAGETRARAEPRVIDCGTGMLAGRIPDPLDCWRRDVPECHADAFARWIVHIESMGRPMGAAQRLGQAKLLAGNGDPAAQTEVVEYCIAQGWRTLVPIADVRARRDGMSRAGPKPVKERWRPPPDEPTQGAA